MERSVGVQGMASHPPQFVPKQLCWVRTSKKVSFYPARVVKPEDLNLAQTWNGKGDAPLYSVIFFDHNNIHAGSAFHVRTLSQIKNWTMGLEEGLGRLKKSVEPYMQRATAYIKELPEDIKTYDLEHKEMMKKFLEKNGLNSDGESTKQITAKAGVKRKGPRSFGRPPPAKKLSAVPSTSTAVEEEDDESSLYTPPYVEEEEEETPEPDVEPPPKESQRQQQQQKMKIEIGRETAAKVTAAPALKTAPASKVAPAPKTVPKAGPAAPKAGPTAPTVVVPATKKSDSKKQKKISSKKNAAGKQATKEIAAGDAARETALEEAAEIAAHSPGQQSLENEESVSVRSPLDSDASTDRKDGEMVEMAPAGQVEPLQKENIVHVTTRFGWIGANSVADEIIAHLLAKTDAKFTVVYDADAAEVAKLAKRLPETKEGTRVAGVASDIPALCDVVFCCAPEIALIGDVEEEEEYRSGHLLGNLLAAAAETDTAIVIMTTVNAFALRQIDVVLAKYPSVPVLGVGVCGRVGVAENIFASGNVELYQRYYNVFLSMGRKIVFSEGSPTRSLARYQVYNRFMLGVLFEAIASRAFAAEYQLDGDQMLDLLENADCANSLHQMVTAVTKRNWKALNREIGSRANCCWLDASAMVTYARSTRSDKMLNGGIHIHEMLNEISSKTDAVPQALADYFCV